MSPLQISTNNLVDYIFLHVSNVIFSYKKIKFTLVYNIFFGFLLHDHNPKYFLTLIFSINGQFHFCRSVFITIQLPSVDSNRIFENWCVCLKVFDPFFSSLPQLSLPTIFTMLLWINMSICSDWVSWKCPETAFLFVFTDKCQTPFQVFVLFDFFNQKEIVTAVLKNFFFYYFFVEPEKK